MVSLGVSWVDLVEAARTEERNQNFAKAAGLYAQARMLVPAHPEPVVGLLRTLILAGDADRAGTVYAALPAAFFDNADALAAVFPILLRMNHVDAALNTAEILASLGRDIGSLISQLANTAAHHCAWSVRDRLFTLLRQRARAGNPCVIDLFPVFAMTDDTDLHRRLAAMIAEAIARQHASLARKAGSPKAARGRHVSSRRLRVAYLGGNFSRHATTLLLSGVIEQHDRDRCEVMLFDYSAEDGSAARQRLLRAFDRVELLGNAGPRASAERIARARPDILIDAHGYTARTRSEILAYRPCAVQINFLGYVGTQAASWCDYVVADGVVLPNSERHRWREAVISMPNSYYPNDRSRPVPVPATKAGRAARGLPEGAFVFACFNNLYKVTPEMFAVWMRLLCEASDSVLWSLDSNPHARENLKREAAALGVSPARLVFAKPADLQEHINRHEYSDLFVDTFPYGAHTTGADARWAGLPVVTKSGRSFASRVAASLVSAVGLPQLVCDCDNEYFEKSLFYYRNPGALRPLRAALTTGRTNSTLFDAELYARHLEAALRQALIQRPRDINVSDLVH